MSNWAGAAAIAFSKTSLASSVRPSWLSLAFHSRQKLGDIMFRMTGDRFAVQTMLVNRLLPIISAIVLLARMLLILIPLDPVLTMLSMSVVPVLFLLIAFFNRRIADVATDVRDAD